MTTARKKKPTSKTQGVRMSLTLRAQIRRAARRVKESQNAFVVRAVSERVARVEEQQRAVA